MTFFWRPPASCLNGNLPAPVSGFPCGLKCAAGTKINVGTKQCEDCPAGTASSGTGVTWSNWDEWPVQMVTYCTLAVGGRSCSPWRLLGSTVDSGNNYNKNLLSSVIELRVQLLDVGFVYYEYKVSAEKDWDGLEVFIDGVRVSFESNRTWTSAQWDLTAGYHIIKWSYFKDYSVSYGDDRATIRSIQIMGINHGHISCVDCGPGQYSSSSLSPICNICGANTYSEFEYRSTRCIPCTASEYSAPGSSKCTPRVDCSDIDITSYYTPCLNGITHNKTFAWIHPSACDVSNATLPPPIVKPCDSAPLCPPGQLLVNSQCQYCSTGSYSSEYNATTCLTCGIGSASGPRTALYQDWNPATLWTDGTFTSDCTSCYSGGWRAAYNFVDSGAGLAVGSESAFRMKLNMTHPGSITFNVSLSCPTASRLGIHVAGNIAVVNCTGCNAVPQLITVPLPTPGQYLVRITYHKEVDSNRTCDRAVINSIKVVGSNVGGATNCELCPAGTFTQADGYSICEDCPAGTASSAGANHCTNCLNGAFSMQGWPECLPCGESTAGSPDHTDCLFSCSRLNVNGSIYNLTALSAMKGPISLDNSTQANSTSLYLSLCNRIPCSIPGEPESQFFTYACASSLDAAKSLGDAPAFVSLADPTNRGILATYSHGDDECITAIQLRCDLSNYDGTLELQSYSNEPGNCSFQWLWASYYACPLCVAEDYTTYTTPCSGGKQQQVWVNTRPGQCRDGVPKPLTIQVDCKEEVAFHYTTVIVMSVIAAVVLVVGVGALSYLYIRNKKLYAEYSQLKDQKTNIELSEDVERTTDS